MSPTKKTHNAETEKETEKNRRMKSHSTNQLYSLSYDVIEVMENALIDLVRETDSECALVVDRTGCIMASNGTFNRVEPSTMGATAAATAAALSSFSPTLRIQEACVDFFQDGSNFVYFSSIEERLILCVLNKQANSPEFRQKCRMFSAAITSEISADKNRLISGQQDLAKSVSYIENKLDQLFKDHTTPT